MDVEEKMKNVIEKALKGNQHKLDHDKDGDIDAKDFKMLRNKKKKGETATMNPKIDSGKDKSSSMEQKESKIRDKLLAVLEASKESNKHSPNKDKAEKPEDALKGAGAKQMKKDNEDDGRYHELEKQSHDDADKAARTGPSRKMRPNDNAKGDSKIINQPADTTKNSQAPAVRTEKYDTMSGLRSAYASMYEVKDEAEKAAE